MTRPITTGHNWRSKNGGVEVSEARRLKALEIEYRKFKKHLAESMLDVSTAKEVLGNISDARGAYANRVCNPIQSKP